MKEFVCFLSTQDKSAQSLKLIERYICMWTYVYYVSVLKGRACSVLTAMERGCVYVIMRVRGEGG